MKKPPSDDGGFQENGAESEGYIALIRPSTLGLTVPFGGDVVDHLACHQLRVDRIDQLLGALEGGIAVTAARHEIVCRERVGLRRRRAARRRPSTDFTRSPAGFVRSTSMVSPETCGKRPVPSSTCEKPFSSA